jgi:hypothetical protein
MDAENLAGACRRYEGREPNIDWPCRKGFLCSEPLLLRRYAHLFVFFQAGIIIWRRKFK